jgi:hypothetical protein
MPGRLAIVALLVIAASAARAQDTTEGSVSMSMAQLVKDGYEIKAAAPNGSRYVVFMQKEKSAYACEFVNVTTTRCRQIN